TWDDAPAGVAKIDANDVVTNASTTWRLGIDRDPSWTPSLTGGGGVAPGPDGTFVYVTTIGGAVSFGSDYPDHDLATIAVLRPAGAGTGRRIPDGWRFESSSPAGILISRYHGDSSVRELALVDTVGPSASSAPQIGIAHSCDPLRGAPGRTDCTILAVDPT